MWVSNFILEKHCISHIHLHYHDEIILSTSWPGTGDETPCRGISSWCYAILLNEVWVKLYSRHCSASARESWCLNTVQNNYIILIHDSTLNPWDTELCFLSKESLYIWQLTPVSIPDVAAFLQRVRTCMQTYMCTFYMHTTSYCRKWVWGLQNGPINH